MTKAKTEADVIDTLIQHEIAKTLLELMTKTMKDTKGRVVPSKLEAELTEMLRGYVGSDCKNAATPAETMVGVTMFLARSSLVIGAALCECDHTECAKHKGQAALAAMVVTARDMVARAMKRPEEEGVADRKGCGSVH